MLIPPMVQEINNKLEKLELYSVKFLLKELGRLFSHFNEFKGEFISHSADKIPELVNFLVKILTTSEQDKKTREDEIKSRKKMTEDDILEFKEELEKLDKVWDYS